MVKKLLARCEVYFRAFVFNAIFFFFGVANETSRVVFVQHPFITRNRATLDPLSFGATGRRSGPTRRVLFAFGSAVVALPSFETGGGRCLFASRAAAGESLSQKSLSQKRLRLGDSFAKDSASPSRRAAPILRASAPPRLKRKAS